MQLADQWELSGSRLLRAKNDAFSWLFKNHFESQCKI